MKRKVRSSIKKRRSTQYGLPHYMVSAIVTAYAKVKKKLRTLCMTSWWSPTQRNRFPSTRVHRWGKVTYKKEIGRSLNVIKMELANQKVGASWKRGQEGLVQVFVCVLGQRRVPRWKFLVCSLCPSGLGSIFGTCLSTHFHPSEGEDCGSVLLLVWTDYVQSTTSF